MAMETTTTTTTTTNATCSHRYRTKVSLISTGRIQAEKPPARLMAVVNCCTSCIILRNERPWHICLIVSYGFHASLAMSHRVTVFYVNFSFFLKFNRFLRKIVSKKEGISCATFEEPPRHCTLFQKLLRNF